MAERPKKSEGLPSELLETISHGCAASVICGLSCILWQPWLRDLLLSQSEPTLSMVLYLFVCVQIGIVVSVVVTVLCQTEQ